MAASQAATTEYSTLYATFPAESQAKDLARKLVEERLANFVNVLPSMQTVYREVVGEVQEDSEVLLIAKVRTADARLVIDFVTKSSPTDTAEIYTLPMTHLSEPFRNHLSSTLI